MYFVYVITSLKTGQRYIGSTSNLELRLKEHNQGHSRYTKSRAPWKLIYVEQKKTKSAADIREKFLKTGDGRRCLKRLLDKLVF